MKKILFSAITASMLLASCSSDEIVESSVNNGAKPMSLSIYQQGLTRSFNMTSISDITDSQDGFDISIYTADDTIYAGKVTVDANGRCVMGDGKTTYYWPLDKDTEVTFAGYFDNGGDDLYFFQTATQTTSGAITLSFKHLYAAADINLSLADENTGSVAQIISMTITGPAKNVFDYATGQWTIPANSRPVVYDFIELILSEAEGIIDDQPLLLAGDDGGDIFTPGEYSIEVKYDVVSEDDFTIVKTETPLTKTGKFTLTAGKIKSISILLPVTQTPLTVNINGVEDWDEDTAEDINVK